MKLIDTSITLTELSEMSSHNFNHLVKAVVDIKQNIMVVDAELHADEEAYLLSNGSKQTDLWGINLYPEVIGEDFIEFDSMINLRPSQGNHSRSVDNLDIQTKIRQVVNQLVI